jgi:hypothetical protein
MGDAGGEQDADGEADKEGKCAAEERFKPVQREDGRGGEGLHGDDGYERFQERDGVRDGHSSAVLRVAWTEGLCNARCAALEAKKELGDGVSRRGREGFAEVAEVEQATASATAGLSTARRKDRGATLRSR